MCIAYTHKIVLFSRTRFTLSGRQDDGSVRAPHFTLPGIPLWRSLHFLAQSWHQISRRLCTRIVLSRYHLYVTVGTAKPIVESGAWGTADRTLHAVTPVLYAVPLHPSCLRLHNKNFNFQ